MAEERAEDGNVRWRMSRLSAVGSGKAGEEDAANSSGGAIPGRTSCTASEAAAEKVARDKEDIVRAAPLRLSAWMLSFAVALFALPLGVMLLVLNCAKGENLRLASQTAALTGTFIGFQTFGTTAHAMTALQGFIG